MKLSKYDPTDTPQALDQLRRELEKYPNARMHVREFRNGPPITAPIAVRVIGPDLDRLHDMARKVERVIEETPGTRDVQNPVRMSRTNLSLDIDSQKAALLGVPAGVHRSSDRVAGIPSALQTATATVRHRSHTDRCTPYVRSLDQCASDANANRCP